MTKNPVLILHGWSDTHESFRGIRNYLCEHGYDTASVYLGSYRSMEDNTTFDNVADGLQARLDGLVRNHVLKLDPFSLDVIAHSTGGPVIRHWLTQYLKNVCDGDFAKCPIRRMVLLAPANFGSRLAAQGQSALAMIFRGGIKHGFQTGRAILQGLELGSPFLRELADRDLFCDKPIYPVDHDQGPYVFVFSGTSTYDRLKGLVAPGANEDGSDGTIRAAAAALSSIRLRVDFRQPTPKLEIAKQKNEPIAFKLVPDKNHSEIVPRVDENDHPMLPLILDCLAVDNWAAYTALRTRFEAENADVYEPDRSQRVGRYQQFVIRVRDDMDVDVDDYQLSFHVIDDMKTTSTWTDHSPGQHLTKYQSYTVRVQEKVIAHVQAHTVSPCHRTFFVDLDELGALRGELQREFGNRPQPPFIAMNIEAFSGTPDVAFDTDNLHYVRLDHLLGDPTAPTFFFPNTTTLVDIRLKPTVGEAVFKLYGDDGD